MKLNMSRRLPFDVVTHIHDEFLNIHEKINLRMTSKTDNSRRLILNVEDRHFIMRNRKRLLRVTEDFEKTYLRMFLTIKPIYPSYIIKPEVDNLLVRDAIFLNEMLKCKIKSHRYSYAYISNTRCFMIAIRLLVVLICNQTVYLSLFSSLFARQIVILSMNLQTDRYYIIKTLIYKSIEKIEMSTIRENIVFFSRYPYIERFISINLHLSLIIMSREEIVMRILCIVLVSIDLLFWYYKLYFLMLLLF